MILTSEIKRDRLDLVLHILCGVRISRAGCVSVTLPLPTEFGQMDWYSRLVSQMLHVTKTQGTKRQIDLLRLGRCTLGSKARKSGDFTTFTT